MTNGKATKLILLFALVSFPFLLPAQAANTIASNSTSNATSFELTSSTWYQPNTANLSISTSTGTTVVISTVEAKTNSTGAKLLARIKRDGVEIWRVNVTESAYIFNLPIIAVFTETEGTHYYALELSSPTGKKTFVNNWTLGVTSVTTGAYITEGITNASASINVTQVIGLRGEQDAQNTSTTNLQYNDTIHDQKFNNANSTYLTIATANSMNASSHSNASYANYSTSVLQSQMNATNISAASNDTTTRYNDTVIGLKLNNQNTTNEQLRANDTIDRSYLNITFPGSTAITILGVIATGTWQGVAIADAYVASSALWNSYVGKIDANNASISNLQYNSTVYDQKFNNINASLTGINSSVNSSNYNDTVHDQKFNNANASFLTITTGNAMNTSSSYNFTLILAVMDFFNLTKSNKTEVVGNGTTNQMNISSDYNNTNLQSKLDNSNATKANKTEILGNSTSDAMNVSSAYNNTNILAKLDSINGTKANKTEIIGSGTTDQMNLTDEANHTHFQAVSDAHNATFAAQSLNNTYNNNTFVKMNNASYVQTGNTSYVKTDNTSYLKNTTLFCGANTTCTYNANGSVEIASSGSRLEKVDYFTGDGITINFTLSQALTQTTTSRVYINGLRQRQGALGSYVEHSTFIEFASAPPLSDLIEVEYV